MFTLFFILVNVHYFSISFTVINDQKSLIRFLIVWLFSKIGTLFFLSFLSSWYKDFFILIKPACKIYMPIFQHSSFIFLLWRHAKEIEICKLVVNLSIKKIIWSLFKTMSYFSFCGVWYSLNSFMTEAVIL